MQKNKGFLFFIIVLSFIAIPLIGQTESPYSRYGYGVLSNQAVGASRAMGGIGYGLRNNLSANPINPASYSSVDSLTFMFDVGVSAKKARLNDGVNSESKNTGGLDYVSVLVPIKKNFGLSFGILPYSLVGYSFGSTQDVGGITYTKAFSGTGGFSQIYAGLGYLTPVKNFSVGFNAYYIFGQIQNQRSLPNITGVADYNTSTEISLLNIKTGRVDLGLQYELPLSKDNSLVLGASYFPRINSTGSYDKFYIEYSSNNAPKTDTLALGSRVDAGLPESFGAGFTFVHGKQYTVGADVMYQKWKDVKYSDIMGDGLNNTNRFNNKFKISAGGEYAINPYDRSFLKKIKFRGGFNYGNSYVNVINSKGNLGSYNEYGATFGLGLPIRDRESYGNRTTYLNITMEYKKLSPQIPNMISEQYFGVAFNVNINELWFFRRKVE